MKSPKKRIFCPVPLPPPFYGSNIVNKDVVNSRILNETFDIDVLPISYNQKTENVGRFEIFKVFLIFKYFFQICKKNSEKFDLVYYVPAVVGWAFIRDLFLILPLKLTKQKLLIHIHGKGIKTVADKNVLYKRLYKYFFKNTSVICLSEKLVYDVKSVHTGPIYVINNGIKKESYSFEIRPNKTPIILYLSNLVETKGVLVLLEAANILKKQQVDFKLNLVGAPIGDITAKINNLISKYNLENYILSVGPKYDDDKKRALHEASVFVLPTFYNKECFPLVILEAMSCNLPVISTDEGAILDIVEDGKTGLIVNKEDPVDLAHKISLLLSDEELRVKLGQKGGEKFQDRYLYRVVEEKLFEVFNEVINSNYQ